MRRNNEKIWLYLTNGVYYENKKVFILSALLIGIIVFITLVICFNQKSYSINEITNNKFDDVHYVINEEGEKLPIETIKNKFSNYDYKIYAGSLGNTSRYKYQFYSKEDICLFYIEDIGNKNLFSVDIDDKKVVYQAEKINWILFILLRALESKKIQVLF